MLNCSVLKNEELSFTEWLKKKPDNNNYNHYYITREYGIKLINIIKQKKIDLKYSDNEFIKKFQYFLYKRSSHNNSNYKYYYK